MIWRSINEQCWIRSCLLDNTSTLPFNKIGSVQKVKLGLVAIIFIVFLHLIGISVSEFHTNPNDNEILWRDK